MTAEDVAVVGAMIIVPTVLIGLAVLAALAVGRLLIRGGHAGYAVTAAVLTAVLVGAMLGAFWFWGVGFDYADTFRQPPAYVDRAIALSASIALGAYAGILLTGLLAVRAHRRLSPTG